jgi:pyridoxine/pyridoxamine 5'-phosphate oxidase
LSESEHPRPAEPTPSRPAIPAGYGIEHSPSAEMIPWSAVGERLAGARNYWLGTTRPDGRPHAAPVWGVWLNESFYFATDLASRKARNLAVSPELVVHLESGDDVVILEGTAEAVADPSLLTRFADAYEAKYQFRPDTSAAAPGVYRLRPRVAFAWLERNFPRSATRFTF